MTLLLVAIVAILVLLVLIRVSAKAGGATVSSSMRPSRDRRSGHDRRLGKFRVPRERRKAPRRFEDVASAYVARIDRSRPPRNLQPGSRG
jgi:hypothetical protein